MNIPPSSLRSGRSIVSTAKHRIVWCIGSRKIEVSQQSIVWATWLTIVLPVYPYIFTLCNGLESVAQRCKAMELMEPTWEIARSAVCYWTSAAFKFHIPYPVGSITGETHMIIAPLPSLTPLFEMYIRPAEVLFRKRLFSYHRMHDQETIKTYHA